MDAELLNPFLTATMNVLSTMASTKATPGKPSVKSNHLTWGTVTGLIGMAGTDVTGNLVISFEDKCILSIVSKMLMEEFKEVNQDVVDAVGEITNMVSGGTKAGLNEKGYSFDMATPVVLVGKSIEMSQLTKTPIIMIPFETDAGKFMVEASLAKRTK